MYSSSSNYLALSKTILPTAAWTVAFGDQANPIKAFSLKVKSVPGTEVTATTAQNLKPSPIMIMKNETTIVLGWINERSTAAPIDPNKNGQQTYQTDFKFSDGIS